MPYVVPQAVVYQELQQVPTELIDPLRAHISGGNAWLVRYDESTEKVLGALGSYDAGIDDSHTWPNKPAGGLIDQDYTRVFIDGALLEYFVDTIGSGSTIAPVSGRTDRIRASALGFRTNGEYVRSVDFYDRDVTPGDIVYIRGVVDAENVELWSYVRGIAYEQTAAVTGTATADAANVATAAASSSVSQVAGTENCVTLLADLSTYNSWVDGNTTDTYTVEVIQGSVGGDFTTARVRITSASGADDIATFSPDEDGQYLTVGTRDLQISFSVTGDGSSCSAEDPDTANDLIAGQKWELSVVDNTEAAVGTSAGTYTGTADTTYIVEVSRGGEFADADTTRRPQITVRTTHGTDLTSAIDVAAENTAVAVGSKGITIKFTKSAGSLTGLRKGDQFTIAATASANGRASTLILGHALGSLTEATDLDLKLYIKKNIEVTKNRTGFAPLTNWDTSATEITVNSGIVAYDSTWTDGGTQMALDVKGGSVYVEYRAWLTSKTGDVFDIDDVNALDDIPGPLSPDNPLKFGVYCALLNSSGTVVRYTAVADPDDADSWIDALSNLDGRAGIYNLVALTTDQTVLSAVVAHVNSQSSAENGRWRGAFVPLTVADSVALVNSVLSTDETTVLATISDDPETSGTQYTWLEVPASNADFVAAGVASGDIVRIGYTTDGFDGETYSEYVIDAVINEDSLRLVSGPVAAISTAQKIEVWHTRTKNELARAIAATAGAYGNRRICAVWPDELTIGGQTVAGMFGCAVMAGRRSGVVPQQGMTNLSVSGIDAVPRTTRTFGASQLNIMAEAGVFIITQDTDGNVFARHALTTDTTSLSTREEMYRANFDSISYFLLAGIKPYIGISNVTRELLSTLRTELDSRIDVLKSSSLVARIGAQLIDGTVLDLRQHALLRDRVVAVVGLDLPYPFNNAEIYLVA